MKRFKVARQRRRTMRRGRRRREEERRRPRTEGYEPEQGIYKRKQREEGVSGVGRRKRRRSSLIMAKNDLRRQDLQRRCDPV